MSPFHHPDDEDKGVVLSGNSPIQVKFIGWLVVVCAGGFAGSIWWAATMSTKLDTVISNQATAMAATKAIFEDVSRLKEWRAQIDTIGPVELVKRADGLRRDLDELRTKFDLHVATTTAPPH